MMKKKLSLVLLVVIIAACVIGVVWVFNPMSILNSSNQECILPPEGFSEADLVGTWVATRGSDTDTLIIREDGKYKQTIHIEYIDRPDVHYESDWLPWWLEYSESGIPYLHLEGMRLCAAESVSCDQVGGGNVKWYDICRDK
jgi:hypothetical protein